LIIPNHWHQIHIIADGERTSYAIDGESYFDYVDPHAYQSGYFGFRTFNSHLRFRNFKVMKESREIQ
jgi:hypothetical protein